jgi:hypothetical protein
MSVDTRYPCCVHCEIDHDCANDPCPHDGSVPVGPTKEGPKTTEQ